MGTSMGELRVGTVLVTKGENSDGAVFSNSGNLQARRGVDLRNGGITKAIYRRYRIRGSVEVDMNETHSLEFAFVASSPAHGHQYQDNSWGFLSELHIHMCPALKPDPTKVG